MNELLAEFYGTLDAEAPSGDVGMDKLGAEQSEADFLGRVMAHAFNQELGEIEKNAEFPSPSAVQEALREGARGGVRGEYISGESTRPRPAIEGTGGGSGGRAPSEYRPRAKDAPKASRLRRLARAATKTRGRKAALVGMGAAALGFGGYGVHQAAAGKKKKSADEQFQELVEQRALEHLEAAGYDVGTEKTAADELNQVVDIAALQLLEAEGYPVEWY